MIQKGFLRLFAVLAVFALVVTPAAARDIPAGDDSWATPGGGGTWIGLDAADWEALCGVKGGASQQIVFQGVSLPGQGDASVVVERLGDAVFNSDGLAYVSVRMKTFGLVSTATNSTPCGDLDFRVGLDDAQVKATMGIQRDDDGLGGRFTVELPVHTIVEAIDPSSGAVVGSVAKGGVLSEPAGGTPWSYDPPEYALDPDAPWHPGVTKTGERVSITRYHEFPASHLYRPVIYCGSGSVETEPTSNAAAEPSPCPKPAEPVDPVAVD